MTLYIHSSDIFLLPLGPPLLRHRRLEVLFTKLREEKKLTLLETAVRNKRALIVAMVKVFYRRIVS